jgi:imidazolonepropionase-like amidohydrolase
MLVRAGMTPREALRSATVRPAEFFGLEGEMGRVAEGFRGDLVLLSADPFEDIGNAKAIEAVVGRGRVMWPEEGGGE